MPDLDIPLHQHLDQLVSQHGLERIFAELQAVCSFRANMAFSEGNYDLLQQWEQYEFALKDLANKARKDDLR